MFLFQESGDGKITPEYRDSDVKKGQQTTVRKVAQTVMLPRRSSEEKNEKINKDSPSASSSSEKSTKTGNKTLRNASKSS